MKLIQAGHLWQIDRRVAIEENIRAAVTYFGDKYGEKFKIVAIRTADGEAIEGDTFYGMKLVSYDAVTPGCIFLWRCN